MPTPSPARRAIPYVLVAIALVAGCEALDETSEPPIYAAYTLLAQSITGAPIAYARVIVDGASASCPPLIGGSQPITMSARVNPDTVLFPVKVCEAVIPFAQSLIVSGTQDTLAAITTTPSRIFVYGDTGCKEGDCPGNQPAHPFDSLAYAGAHRDTLPDLILHMGDYNYRGTGKLEYNGKKLQVYDAGDDAKGADCQLDKDYFSQNADSSTQRDQWGNWKIDFFLPAKPLLSKAPWIFARGNHELCSRAGPGWFYFLDAGSNLAGAATPQASCPSQGNLADPKRLDIRHNLQFAESYAVNLDSLRILVLDSANACDAHAPDSTTQIYTAEFDIFHLLTTTEMTTWLMTHRPIWGVTLDSVASPGDTTLSIINQTLQSALHQTSQGTLPSAVTLSLSGHMHRYESLTFSGERPPQVVIGDSGVELDTNPPIGDFYTIVDGLNAHGNATDQFGFLDIAFRTDGSWRGTLVNPPEIIATCDSEQVKSDTTICVLK